MKIPLGGEEVIDLVDYLLTSLLRHQQNLCRWTCSRCLEVKAAPEELTPGRFKVPSRPPPRSAPGRRRKPVKYHSRNGVEIRR